MRVLYLFAGERTEKFKGTMHVDFPDTQFYGLNHLKDFGIEAGYKELPAWLEKIIPFNIKHILLFFYTFRYDVVFGSTLLNTVLLKKIFRTKTKFVLLNISLSRLIRANQHNSFKTKVIHWLLKDIDHVVCLAEMQKKYLVENAILPARKVSFVHLGVDDVFYKPVYEDRKAWYLAYGRDNGRDYKTVIKVAHKLPKSHFEIVCSKRNLEGIDTIPSNVTVTFDIPPNIAKQKLAEAKALLLITKDNTSKDGADCSGQTVLLDAMASSLPVIASRKECVTDYAEGEKDVRLVNFYDADDIVKAIKDFEDDNYRQTLARNSRKKVEGKLSTQAMADQLQKVFASLYGK